ncbi:MAG: sulfatase family protein [Gaiellaceae bacterium]
MRSVITIVATVAALVVATAAQAQPNVVLIVTDDQRWETLQHMPVVQSELVGKGVLFENAFAVNPLCCPSRASILTGLYSHSTGVWSNVGRRGRNKATGGMAAFDDRSTLPVWLDAAGYETMFMGKYIHGYRRANVPPTYVPPGWDQWRAFYGGNGYFNYKISDGTTLHAFGNTEADYSTDVLAGEAARFIRETADPFFLYVAPVGPHKSKGFSVSVAPRHVDAFAGAPYTPRPSVNERRVGDKPSRVRNRGLYTQGQLTQIREEQLEALLAVDDLVDQILTALDETGKLGDTLIALTSDNGHTWGEHRWVGKRMPYEESIRVPLVMRYDALAQPSRAEPGLALNVDLAPTIAAAAGAATDRVEGRSLLPLLAGEPTRWRRSFFFEYYDPPLFMPYCGYRSNSTKYVQYSNGEEELYDLVRDPYELRSKARRNNLTAAVMAYRSRVERSACRPPDFRPLPQCTRSGTGGADRLVGTWREDWICAGRGNDRILVRGDHRDVVRCGRGVDRVRADRHDELRSCEIRLR